MMRTNYLQQQKFNSSFKQKIEDVVMFNLQQQKFNSSFKPAGLAVVAFNLQQQKFNSSFKLYRQINEHTSKSCSKKILHKFWNQIRRCCKLPSLSSFICKQSNCSRCKRCKRSKAHETFNRSDHPFRIFSHIERRLEQGC